jgi:hypothetical protein
MIPCLQLHYKKLLIGQTQGKPYSSYYRKGCGIVPRDVLKQGRISVVDLLVFTTSDQLLLTLEIYSSSFYQTTCPNEEVNRTELSPSVMVPWSK